jgi:hypothetical protein
MVRKCRAGAGRPARGRGGHHPRTTGATPWSRMTKLWVAAGGLGRRGSGAEDDVDRLPTHRRRLHRTARPALRRLGHGRTGNSGRCAPRPNAPTGCRCHLQPWIWPVLPPRQGEDGDWPTRWCSPAGTGAWWAGGRMFGAPVDAAPGGSRRPSRTCASCALGAHSHRARSRREQRALRFPRSGGRVCGGQRLPKPGG